MTMLAHDDALLHAARAWYDAGYCVIPSHEDGGKRPFGRWKDYQAERMWWDELEDLLATGRYSGIGVLTGSASFNVEMIELEGPMTAAVERLQKVVAQAALYAEIDLPELLAKVARGCVEQSAGGGLHLFIRVTDGPALGNTKLAYTLDPSHASGRKIVAETRGEGGFVVVAPTTGRNGHEPGTAYLFINGGHPDKTVNVTSEERDLLHTVIHLALNEAHDTPTEAVAHPLPNERNETRSPGDSTFDDFRNRTTWRDILEPAGWTFSHNDGERDYWVRPGKSARDGHSASTIEDGPLYNFSGNAGLPEETGLSKAAVYAHLNHGGDLTATAHALRDKGYGPQPITYTDLPEWRPNVTIGGLTITPNGDLVEDDPYTAAVKHKFAELRLIDDARAMLAAHKTGKAPDLTGIPLADLLAQPDEETRYRVANLWPAEGRVMLAAAAKSGKTTMVAANLIPSLVDGRPFLGRYQVQPVTGTVVLLNMEVGENTLRRWMRDTHIQRQDAVLVANLRGKASALALNSEPGRQRFANFLRDHNAEIVILDPLAPVLASLGLDENSNADVSLFYSWWSEALTLAGITDDLVVHHTGHAGQRSRGASRLLDEPDAIWTLSKEDTGDDDAEYAPIAPIRFLAAYGRDVELNAEALSYHPGNRQLELTGMGKAAVKGDKDHQAILNVFADGKSRTKNAIVTAAGGSRQKTWDMVDKMVADGHLETVGKSHNGRPLLLPSTLVEAS